MRITVAICTRNRSRLLRQALEQMALAVPPPGVEHEVIVVNNNCSDDTDGVISSCADRLPIRRVFEARPGLSNARNAAVREARGDYVLWTDDDVLVDPRWIAAYVEAFARWPQGVVFGGPISPCFAAPPPLWLERAWPRVASVYATRDLGPDPIRFDGKKLVPYGANFAVRLVEQRLVSYDPELGLRPGSLLGGEETAMVRELLARGHQGWWIPGASVRHVIPAERMTTRYLRSFFIGQGECQVKTEHEDTIDGAGVPMLFGGARWRWRHALAAERRYLLSRLFAPPEIWVSHLITASTAWGRLRQMRRQQLHVA